MKVAIVGAGSVGASIAFAMMIKGTVNEISLIDINADKALGEALDLSHGSSFVQALDIISEDFSGCRNADLVIITAGQNRKPDESRLDLIRKNAAIFRDILPKILDQNPNPLLVIVSNPVDVLTYYTIKVTGLNANRVIGSGTVLDSSRFRYSLSRDYGIDPRNVHAYIIGEHGASAVPLWSSTNIGGVPILRYCHKCKGPCRKEHRDRIFREVVDAGREVIKRKGATYYAVALAVEKIVASVVRDESSILTVSNSVNGLHGITDVCLSLPFIVNREGIVRHIHLKLTGEEEKQLQNSAKILTDYNSILFG